MDGEGGDTGGTGGTSPDWHLLLLPVSERERRARVVEWVCRGLERREKVIYGEVAPGSSRGWLSSALGRSGIDVSAPGTDRRLLVLPPAAFHAPGEQVHLVEQALGEGYPAVRVSAELSTGPHQLVADAIEAYERDMDELCRTRPVSALCQYDRETISPTQLGEAARTHRLGIRESLLQTSPTAGGIAVAGELDTSNAEVLDAALRAVAAATTGGVEINFTDLRFVDAAGCRVLRDVAEQLRTRGVTLVLVAPQPRVARMLALLGLDRLPHIEIVGEAGSGR